MPILTRAAALIVVAMASMSVAGCSLLTTLQPPPSSPLRTTQSSGGDAFPDVVAVELLPLGGRSFDVAVTLSSPYDSPQRYADGWRVLDPEGTVLGTHTLLHDHANEQPFTRTQRGLAIPADVDVVTVEGRDQANGFGGRTLSVEVPGS